MAKQGTRTRTRRARVEPFGAIVPDLPPDFQRELFPRTARGGAFVVMWGLLLTLLAVLGVLVAHHLST